jgi:hypothetical protein
MQKNCETCWIQHKNLDGVIDLPWSSDSCTPKEIFSYRKNKQVTRRKTSAGERELKRKSPGKQRRRVEGGRAAGSCPAQSTWDHCNRVLNLLSPKEDKNKNLVRQKYNNMETRVCQTAI